MSPDPRRVVDNEPAMLLNTTMNLASAAAFSLLHSLWEPAPPPSMIAS
jgi:hypothetical protein